MSNNVLSVKPYPDFEKEIITFDKKGNKVIKKVKTTDNFLVTMKNGNSIVVDKKSLKELGINNSINVEKSVEDDEDDDLIQTENNEVTVNEETDSNITTEDSPLILK